MAELAAAAGDFDRAMVVADAIGHVQVRARALAEVAELAAAAGHFDRAMAVAEAISQAEMRTQASSHIGPVWRAQVFLALARVAAAAGADINGPRSWSGERRRHSGR